MNEALQLALSDEIRPTAARSEIYQVLSRVFVYPESAQVARFVGQEAFQLLRQATDSLPYTLSHSDAFSWQVDPGLSALQSTYSALFDNCKGRAAMSLHEKDYRNADPQLIWEDLIRFYEYFGLSYELEQNRVWPDWIGMELEFLHYLTFMEAGAEAGPRAGYIAAQSDFLTRHPGLWVPQLKEKLDALAADSPYAVYAEFMARYIDAELNYNRQRRAPVPVGASAP